MNNNCALRLKSNIIKAVVAVLLREAHSKQFIEFYTIWLYFTSSCMISWYQFCSLRAASILIVMQSEERKRWWRKVYFNVPCIQRTRNSNNEAQNKCSTVFAVYVSTFLCCVAVFLIILSWQLTNWLTDGFSARCSVVAGSSVCQPAFQLVSQSTSQIEGTLYYYSFILYFFFAVNNID